jgi:hypothetical protein
MSCSDVSKWSFICCRKGAGRLAVCGAGALSSARSPLVGGDASILAQERASAPPHCSVRASSCGCRAVRACRRGTPRTRAGRGVCMWPACPATCHPANIDEPCRGASCLIVHNGTGALSHVHHGGQLRADARPDDRGARRDGHREQLVKAALSRWPYSSRSNTATPLIGATTDVHRADLHLVQGALLVLVSPPVPAHPTPGSHHSSSVSPRSNTVHDAAELALCIR